AYFVARDGTWMRGRFDGEAWVEAEIKKDLGGIHLTPTTRSRFLRSYRDDSGRYLVTNHKGDPVEGLEDTLLLATPKIPDASPLVVGSSGTNLIFTDMDGSFHFTSALPESCPQINDLAVRSEERRVGKECRVWAARSDQ